MDSPGEGCERHRRMRNKNNWAIIQDVSWENYVKVPQLIMAGYTIMIKEIFNQIENGQMQKFRTVTRANGEKVLEPYLTKKFNVRILDPLTPEELKEVAAANKVAGFSVGATN